LVREMGEETGVKIEKKRQKNLKNVTGKVR
jgi:hypothetical protein